MNREFKLKYDELRDNDPTKAKAASEVGGENQYYTEGQNRTLGFALLDGRRYFLNYSYLLSGEFKSEHSKNQIILTFTSHTVLLQGYFLEQLFTALSEHLPKVVYEVDERYVLNDTTAATLTSILIEKTE